MTDKMARFDTGVTVIGKKEDKEGTYEKSIYFNKIWECDKCYAQEILGVLQGVRVRSHAPK